MDIPLCADFDCLLSVFKSFQCFTSFDVVIMFYFLLCARYMFTIQIVKPYSFKKKTKKKGIIVRLQMTEGGRMI